PATRPSRCSSENTWTEPEDNARSEPASAGGQILHLGARAVGLHRSDPVVARRLAGIHLAGADDLAVRRLQHEVGLARNGGLLFEALGHRAVAAHRFDR